MLAQSYDNWELQLMDASPEWDAVADLAADANDERIRRIELPGNGGIVLNTNAGIEQATGDYIAFLDHDDILEPDALFHYVAALNKEDEGERPQVLFCDEDMFQKTGEWGQPVFKTKLNVDLLYSHNCVTHFLMVEKALIDRIGMSPEDVAGAQDYDLTLRCLMCCITGACIPVLPPMALQIASRMLLKLVVWRCSATLTRWAFMEQSRRPRRRLSIACAMRYQSLRRW